MEGLLQQRMKEKNYGELTIRQRVLDLKKFFKPDFKAAMKKIEEVPEAHKRSSRANKVSSLMKLLPEIKPSSSEYEQFVRKQKEWNVQKNSHYVQQEVKVDNNLDSLVKLCEQKKNYVNSVKGRKEELQALRDYILCLLYVHLTDYIGRSVEFRVLKLWKTDSDKDNYITSTYIYINTQKQIGSKDGEGNVSKVDVQQLKIPTPTALKTAVMRMRKLVSKGSPYIFGSSQPLSQPGYSLYQKRVLGYTTNELRRMILQHRK